ncbi:hypothetical protein OSB04_002086 [Centaurea solstitialis]|uniref:Reverse transcriptase Ty1/copia-type domain-containing protein n=1 Tax=Centaurea solstitialis TaxID=347529 RepID=A0AA38WT05_9ASTR|nr:hypothetical protein OSB04_002086 [Centaurea solstitialis]
MLLYVDDIILTASSPTLISMVILKFPMSNLGPLSFFLGIAASRSKSGLFLSQSAFAQEILARADMVSCNTCNTPADTKTKLAVDGEPVPDPTLYRSLAGALQYLTFTRPDIAYAVQQVCLFMHDPRLPHLNALKRILRYLKGTLSHGLHLKASAVDRLVAYSDADWAGCPNTRRSTSGFCVYLGDNLVSWSSKRQLIMSFVRFITGGSSSSNSVFFITTENHNRTTNGPMAEPWLDQHQTVARLSPGRGTMVTRPWHDGHQPVARSVTRPWHDQPLSRGLISHQTMV